LVSLTIARFSVIVYRRERLHTPPLLWGGREATECPRKRFVHTGAG
jgi:hypothetical protein